MLDSALIMLRKRRSEEKRLRYTVFDSDPA